jgi:hypothetical protein
MYDSIPHDHRAHDARVHTDADVAAVCAAALGVTLDVFAAATAAARKAGYDGDEAVSVAYLSLADPSYGLHAPGGAEADDPTLAAAFRACPRRERDADRRRGSAIARLGDDADWRDAVRGDARLREHEPALTDAWVGRLALRLGIARTEALRRATIRWCLRMQAWQRWPADRSGGAARRRTQYVRDRLAALGYWPDLRQQVYLPAPAVPNEARARGTADRAGAHAWRRWWRREVELGQLVFGGGGWEVVA